MELEDQRIESIEKLSDKLNENGTYDFIKNIAEEDFGFSIDNDSPLWHRIEEVLLDMIIRERTKQLQS